MSSPTEHGRPTTVAVRPPSSRRSILQGSQHTRSNPGSTFAPDEAESLAIDRPPSLNLEGQPFSKVYHPLSLPVLVLLIPASIFGVLARLGLQALATYNGRSIFPLAYPQAIGCLIMGFGLVLKEPFGRFYPPLYTALTTGFCGSLTTFSGWQLDVFSSWVNAGQYNRDGFRNALDGIAKTVFTLALSLASLFFGVHLATIFKPHFRTLPPPTRTVRHSITALSVLIYAASFLAYFRLPVSYRHQATAALLFAFPGTLTRYLLSIWLNNRMKDMPLGTFTANTLGTAALGMFHVLQSTASPASSNACTILQGLADGYCGCLTTVSTFVAEVDMLEGWRAWFYAAISWTTGQVLLLIILGTSYWTGHVKKQVTCSFA